MVGFGPTSPLSQTTPSESRFGKRLDDVHDSALLREMVRFLYQRLDDIDTADDIAKGDDFTYRSIARHQQQRKSERLESDGHDLFLPRNYFAEARRTMAEHFRDKSEGSVWHSYFCNVAMMLWDNRASLSENPDIDKMAKRILQMIFEQG